MSCGCVAYWSSRNLEKIERTILGCPRSSNCQTYYWSMHCLPTSSVERIVATAVTSFAYLSTYRRFFFQTTGTDFAGPLFVNSIYAEQLNVYICLFTCTTSRVVHLELTPSLQGGAFIRALKRFIARRGYPRLLICDSTKTFTCNVVKSFLLRNDIDINFILPVSPWWGGFYERLVRSVKMPLKKVIGKAKLTYEETALVEAVVNCRPLTHIYDSDTVEPLTPSHLFAGRNIGVKSRNTMVPQESDVNTLTRRANYLKKTIQDYWNQFRHLHLCELREHHIHQSKRKTSANNENILKLGDVLITKDDKVRPRNSWRIRLVKSFVVGKMEKSEEHF